MAYGGCGVSIRISQVMHRYKHLCQVTSNGEYRLIDFIFNYKR